MSKKPKRPVEIITARLEITESADLRASVTLSHDIIEAVGDSVTKIVTNPAFLPAMFAAMGGQAIRREDVIPPTSSKTKKPKTKRASANKETP